MNIVFQQELFGILLTALLLTLFEIGFFVYMVAPTIQYLTKNLVRNLGRSLKSKNTNQVKIPESIIDSIQEEEARLLEKINKGIIRDSLWIGGGILTLMFFIIYSLKTENSRLFTIQSAIFVIGSFTLFALFQYYFFIEVGMNYGYPETPESTFYVRQSLLQQINNQL